jgi:hypothetical protein
MYRIVCIIFLITLFNYSGICQKAEKKKGLEVITIESVMSPVEFLASDHLEGREAGSRGGHLAGEYLAGMFKFTGLTPMGDTLEFVPNRYQKLLGAEKRKEATCFQNFGMKEVQRGNNQKLALVRKHGDSEVKTQYSFKTEFDISRIKNSLRIKAPIVFAGYGMVDEESGHNDFSDIDVAGKIVVRLAGLPVDESDFSGAINKNKERHLTKEKNSFARERGAVGVIVVNDEVTNEWREGDFYYNEAMYEGAAPPEKFLDKQVVLCGTEGDYIPACVVSEKVLEDILKGTGHEIDKLKESAARWENTSFDIADSEILMEFIVESRLLNGRNILSKIEGRQKEKYIVVGAHYDHFGKYNGHIWNGADDNASGVSAVLNIARAMKASGVKPEYSIIFACWDGEERGLLGSRYFAENFENPDNIILYLNFDMIGRDSGPDAPGNKVSMIYTKDFGEFADVSREHTEKYGLDLDIYYSGVKEPVGGSDNSWFARRGVPIFWFHTGGHTDYHQASDHPELINREKMLSIIKLSYLDIFEFSTNKSYFEGR